jgi:3-oxoacyl-[acyl-carrier protein] reductase
MDLGLKGRTAAVTGGSEGIGLAIARLLAEEGCEVAICARREDVLQNAAARVSRETGSRVVPLVADVGDEAQATEFIEKTVLELGKIDILVNNAGKSAANIFEYVDDAGWHEDLDIKLFGAIRCSRAAIPHMKHAGWGRIVNITHSGGRQPGPSSLPTSVSRAAGIALTKAMSKDYAAHNILINTVMVGSIRSMQWERRWRAGDAGQTLDEFYAAAGRNAPLKRVGTAHEVAAAVAFLASERASYITGAALAVDGGVSDVI